MSVWRLEGIVFLLGMIESQMPAVGAVPAGTGDDPTREEFGGADA